MLFSCSVVLNSASQASPSFTVSRSLLKLPSIELVMPSNHLILCCPFSCLQSFPASASFSVSQFFTSGGQSIGVSASASVLPMNILNILKIFWLRWTHHGYFSLFLLLYPCTSLHPKPYQHTHTHTHTTKKKNSVHFMAVRYGGPQGPVERFLILHARGQWVSSFTRVCAYWGSLAAVESWSYHLQLNELYQQPQRTQATWSYLPQLSAKNKKESSPHPHKNSNKGHRPWTTAGFAKMTLSVGSPSSLAAPAAVPTGSER